MDSFAFNPTVLPSIPERKGTLLLKSEHMKYGRPTLNSNWHDDREAEPKDYDICNSEERNLLTCTYNRIGNVTDGSLKSAKTTQQESMSEVERLKSDFESRDINKKMVSEANFCEATQDRQTGKPDRGYGSVLPRHKLDHGTRYLTTTHKIDYQYPFQWSPKQETTETPPEPRFNHERSEFTDTANHRRPGLNTWQDCNGTVRNYYQS